MPQKSNKAAVFRYLSCLTVDIFCQEK